MLIARSVTEDKGRLIFDTTETGEEQTVPLPRFLAEQITASFAGRGPDDLVFQGTRGVLRYVLWTPCNRRPEGLDRPLTAVAYVGPAGLEQQNACAVPFHSNNKAFGPSASARLFANHYRRATSTEPPDPSLKTMLLDLFEHPSAHRRCS